MSRFLKAVIWCGVLSLFGRGTDYLTGDRDTVGVIEVTSNIPLLVWGGAATLAALVLTVGLLGDRYRVTIAGAVFAAAIYVMFAWETTIATVLTPPVDDWRHPIAYLAQAILWAVIAWHVAVRRAVIAARSDDKGAA